jgi:ADP-heptose:LPS heptosyltransferase/GT2 family glycosyltransferase
VAILFREYDLLANSGLFDAEYYRSAYPDIAALNVDPLVHYLEHGCRERRNPNPGFDTSFYLDQCQALGDVPDNALFHYLTVGSKRGLRTRAVEPATAAARRPNQELSVQAATAPVMRLYIDVPKSADRVGDVAVQGGLSVIGWALSREGIASVEVALDGRRAAVAYYGIRRPDVAAEFPGWSDCLQSGYAAHIAPKLLTAGRHGVTVTATDRAGNAIKQEFSIDVTALDDDRGPWSLRRKMSQVEVDLKLALLARLNWNPKFRIVLRQGIGEDLLAKSRRTLESLSRQVYPRWNLSVAPGTPPRAALIVGFEDCADRVVDMDRKRQAQIERAAPVYVLSMAPGDEMGCDALLELALASAFDRQAELIYGDERRSNPIDGKPQAFFKPRWSPDLLLSTNYIGRAWCASSKLLKSCGLELKGLAATGDYEAILHLTESAGHISHTSKLLFQRAPDQDDGEPVESKALAAALTRRKIPGDVQRGCAPHYYRVRRKLLKRPRVSIIVPTCAAGGLIKTCVESLRERTAYRDFEMVCIENISVDRKRWKPWLAKNLDTVIATDKPFNWSRFNNAAAARARGEYLLFLNDDIEVIEPEWLDALIEHVQRPEVGAVGAQLLYPDRTVQHAGIALDREGRGRHVFRHQQPNDPGYFGLALTQRNVIGVTGACLMTRRETFAKLGRFTEAHAVVNGDLDYCLKSWSSGFSNIYTPYARLIHHELASRSKLKDQYDVDAFHAQWRGAIAAGDPYFNPRLSLENDQVTIDSEPYEEVHAGTPLFDAASVRRILVVKVDHIGDCITAVPVVQRLKRAFPSARMTVLAAPNTAPIWKAEASVDSIVNFELFHARSGLGTVQVKEEDLSKLGASLRRMRFDLAVDLRKQPDTRHLLPLSGARWLAGFDHQGRFPWLDVALEWDEDVPLRAKHGHVTTDLNALVDRIVSASRPAERTTTLRRSSPKSSPSLGAAASRRLFARPLVCVHPGAGSEMRQWPLAQFSALIDGLMELGTIHVAVIGGADDADLVRRVLGPRAKRHGVFNLAGKLPLSELPTLLARASLFVGNNSGPQHMAASLGIPTIGIHSGVVDAHEWGPLGARAVAVRRHMSCSPCFIEHAKDCPRGLACLSGIDSRDVLGTCLRMLALVEPRRWGEPQLAKRSGDVRRA